MAQRTERDAVKWVHGALRQYGRLCDSYDFWREHHARATRDGDRSWTLEARQTSGALSDAHIVDAHLFLVAASQLVKTLSDLGRQDLLDLVPSEQLTHARNAMEHDDDRGLYRQDYQGFGWTIGESGHRGPYDICGLRIDPVVTGFEEIARRLGHTPMER